ncbi:AAA family ATPase [Robiginitalea sp. IMCC44478]|uniref:AAA family ATPase n=1 Tax=Robiginitalea sp. IMCC44478 TaxID=3459122 RepID=UPI0040420D4A
MQLQASQLIFESGTSLIYKANDQGEDVIVKLLKDTSPSSDLLLTFHNEYEYTKDIYHDKIRKARRKEKIDNKYALILDYFEGVSVGEAFVRSRRPLLEILEFAVLIAEAISHMHQLKLIHKDITKDNVLVNLEKKSIQLIDFGLSSKIDIKTSNLSNPDTIEGNLFYIAPEQTGRMNRKVDYRSDLYSFGILLYEMLTGKLPFFGEDSLEIVHKHMTELPASPTELDPEIPRVVSEIVMTLLNKNAEDRYQSSIGLKNDLQTAYTELADKGKISEFPLSIYDFTGHFIIPEKLYGREKELDILMQAFSKIKNPTVEALFVSGYSGVGKSALINETHIPITREKGYFIKGKFDQFQRDVPYFAFTEALNELCRYLLSEAETKLEYYRDLMLEALGDLGKIIIDIAPRLELIIGPQPEVTHLDARENSNRFNRVFLKFIRSISLAEHPLVLFLDDLQWADMGSIQIIRQIISSHDHPNFLFIGAFRDNEVDKTHPLALMLREARLENSNIHDIELKHLEEQHVHQMLAETLHEDSDAISGLTEVVYKKTQGNAFFTIQLITSILSEGHIEYDLERNKWKIDLEQIRKKNYSENVVDFMASRLSELPDETLTILKQAACIGNQFEISILAHLSGTSRREVFLALKMAITEELVIPLDEDYQLLAIDEEVSKDRKFLFNFSHDRIQQAAYSRIKKGDRTKLHFKIAKILSEIERNGDYLFETVHQFNNALALLTEADMRITVATLNFRAATKARNATAYSSALNYIQIAEGLLPKDCWKNHYELSFGLKALGAEVSYLLADSQRSDAYIEECLDNASDPIERADIYYIKMLRLTIANLYEEAINTGRSCLKELGYDFPSENLDVLIGENMERLLTYFNKEGVASIAGNPVMKDPANLAIIKILDNFSMPTYVGGYTQLWILQACMKVNFSLANGNTPETAYAFSELGLILNLQGQYQFALQCGELSRTLSLNFEKISLRHKARSFHLIANYIFIWHKHVNSIAEINDEGFQASMDSGELIFAGYTNFHPFYNKFYSGGVQLEEIKEGLPDAIRFNEKIKMDLAMDALISLEMCLNCLTGDGVKSNEFRTKRFSEKEFISLCEQKKDFYGIATLHTYKACALYINGHFKEAAKSIDQAYQFVAPLIGSIVHFTSLKFYEALINFQLYPKARDKKSIDQKIEEIIGLFENLNRAGKANIEHKLQLLRAERFRLKGNLSEAEQHYLHAIDSAKEYGFLQNEAIAHELLGRLWLEQNKKIYANIHFEKAGICFYQWGAIPKQEALKQEFPEVFARPSLSRGYTDSQNSYAGYNSGSFDTKTLLKASQVLAEEIRLPDLLAKTLEIISENAGADKCAIILKRERNWYVEALSDKERPTGILSSIKLNKCTDLPQEILSYCIRSRDEFIMQEGEHDNLIDRDAYMQKYLPKSVAVIPSFLKKELRVLLYLENSVTADAFSRGKLQILNMLSGQIAISIENARLYDNLNNLNQAYQKFVPYKFLNTLEKESILDVNLGDHIKQDMTAVFSDIRDYTSFSEKLSPQENFDFMNTYLNTVGPIIEANDGIVIQFIGDGILSLYADPNNALKASIQSQEAVNELNKQLIASGKTPIRLGFGIHTGPMILGIIGDEKRRQAGVISSEINTVSRIEGLNKLFGTSIILSEDTFSQIQDKEKFSHRYLGKVQVKGQEGVLRLYEFFDGESPENAALMQECLETFNTGLQAYYNKDFITAAAQLKKVLERNPKDVTAERYLKNAADCMVKGVPDDWTGVERITSK